MQIGNFFVFKIHFQINYLMLNTYLIFFFFSLSQLVDSVVAEVHLLNEAITTDEDELLTAVFQPVEHRPHHHHHQHHPHQQHHQASVPKICVEDSEDHLRTTNEEEELSEYWDQVSNYLPSSNKSI